VDRRRGGYASLRSMRDHLRRRRAASLSVDTSPIAEGIRRAGDRRGNCNDRSDGAFWPSDRQSSVRSRRRVRGRTTRCGNRSSDRCLNGTVGQIAATTVLQRVFSQRHVRPCGALSGSPRLEVDESDRLGRTGFEVSTGISRDGAKYRSTPDAHHTARCRGS
jgi:hypothetical protein